jgi:hypothetical protein
MALPMPQVFSSTAAAGDAADEGDSEGGGRRGLTDS